ncbi:MAG: ubiquinol-cytochrome C chaperone [Acetobacteraceae bacterium]|nr:ubiquinol-cytochrome C chaperone [Acetobacteraceae bacterium]
MRLLEAILPSRRGTYERAGFMLYAQAVAAARQPLFYAEYGVADTLDGRFDLVALFAALVIERLRTASAPGPQLAQAVFDAMFSDMDVTLREIGVGDLSVGKKVRKMWEAFHGRALVYGAALQAADEVALATAIARNIWRGNPPPEGAAGFLACHALNVHRDLASQSLEALARGEIRLVAP